MNSHLHDGFVTGLPIADIDYRFLIDNYLTAQEPLFRDRENRPFPASWWNTQLSAGFALVEGKCDICIIPRQIVEMQDYETWQISEFVLLQTERTPVQEVISIAGVFPSSVREGHTMKAWVSGTKAVEFADLDRDQFAFEFPLNWIKMRDGGQIQIVPTAGGINAAFLGVGGAFMPMVLGTGANIPNLWRVEYIAGFHNTDVPFMLLDAVMKAAAINCYTRLSELMRPPGVKSMSLETEGVKRTYAFEATKGVASVFSSSIAAYREDLYGSSDMPSSTHVGGLLQQIKDKYQGEVLYSL